MSQINRPKLWQAILKGCDNAPQGFYKFKEFLPNGSYRTCAIGAAFDAVDNIEPYMYQFGLFPILENNVDIYCCDILRISLRSYIVHLNDEHKWPREKIALEIVKPLEEDG